MILIYSKHSGLAILMGKCIYMCKDISQLSSVDDYSVLLIQLDRNLASDVSTRLSGRPQGMKTSYETR